MLHNKRYFVTALAALIVAGFMATTLISHFVARDSLSRSISEDVLPLTSDNIYSEIQRDLLRPVLISSVMATDTFMRDWALEGEEDPGRIQSYLQEIQQQYNTITAFYVSENSRNYYHPDGIIKAVDIDDPDDDWYFRVREMSDEYEINIDTDTADRSRVNIFINYRVLDYSGRYMGVTGVGLSVDAVTRLIDNYQQRYSRSIYFTDRQGRITLTGTGIETETARIQDMPGIGSLATQVLSSPSTSFNYNSESGETVYINSRIVPEFDWHLIVEQRSGQEARRIDNTLLINLGLSLLIVVLVLVIAHFTLRSYQLRLEEMATTDKLTGAANRHMFDMILSHAIKTQERRERPLCLVSLDIDHFKIINDSYGHPAGDLILQTVAGTIREHIRDSDTLCRWGGEEFLILLEDCPTKEAAELAERIRNAIKTTTTVYVKDRLNVTASLGVTRYRQGETMDALIARVDAALYDAKEQGRDRIRLVN